MRNRLCVLCIILLLPAILCSAESSDELYWKGVKLAKASKTDEAVLVFKRVIEISPWFCLGHYGLGKSLLMKKGNLDDAIKHLKRCVELDRSFARGYFYLGIALFFKKKHIAAIHAFMSAYENDPAMIEALYNVGAAYDVAGNTFKSKLYFTKYYIEKRRIEEGRLF